MHNKSIQSELVYWAQLRQKCRLAFFKLYNICYDDLYKYGIKISNNDDLTRDVIHDIFVALWTRCQHLPDVTSVKPYLLRMMRNMIIVHLKRSNKEIRRNDLEFIGDKIQYCHQELNETYGIESERIPKLLYVLNQLTARQKELILLRFYNRCTYAEMAEITGIEYQSLRNAIYRALKKLKEIYKKEVTKQY